MPKPEVVLIFGESNNDRAALKELANALAPKIPPIHLRREPLVLIKGRGQKEARHAAQKIASVVRADSIRSNVMAVVAHEDCDAIEPAHDKLSAEIEGNITAEGVPNPIAATPAYEMEAWWYLWPDAVASVCSKWNRLNRKGEAVGYIIDSKKQLQRDLRPKGKGARAPDYEERHSIPIAEIVRKTGCIDNKDARSESFELFAAKIRSHFR